MHSIYLITLALFRAIREVKYVVILSSRSSEWWMDRGVNTAELLELGGGLHHLANETIPYPAWVPFVVSIFWTMGCRGCVVLFEGATRFPFANLAFTLVLL